jgi:hypothetical protein
MTKRSDESSPRRYFSDKSGHRVLIGLTIEETTEFETLDGLPVSDDSGGQAPSRASGMTTITWQERWSALYAKHDAAWRVWLVETCADRSQTLTVS